MPRFYFHLKSKEARIPDDSGKDFDTLNDAYKHGLKLIDKILQRAPREESFRWRWRLLVMGCHGCRHETRSVLVRWRSR
jgi:hypothetical protein